MAMGSLLLVGGVGAAGAAPHHGLAQRHQVPPVLAMGLFDRVARLGADALELGGEALDLGFELEDMAHALEVQPRRW